MRRFQRRKSLFSCTLRCRLFLGRRWAAKRALTPSQQVLCQRRDFEDILKQRVHPVASAKRLSSEDSLETEDMCSKRHMKEDPPKKIKKERSIARVSRELRKEYHMTIDDDFFDVPPLDEASYGSLQAFDFTEDPEEEQQIYSGVNDALGQYNQSWGTDYELVDVVMTNSAVVRGMLYYITFTGISTRKGLLETFQAKLWLDYTYRMHFVYCRKRFAGKKHLRSDG